MKLEFEEWAKYGWEHGWCSPPLCQTCDGLPMTLQEELALETGEELCMHILRLYQSSEDRMDAESTHAPSQWRASNRGWSVRADRCTDSFEPELE